MAGVSIIIMNHIETGAKAVAGMRSPLWHTWLPVVTLHILPSGATTTISHQKSTQSCYNGWPMHVWWENCMGQYISIFNDANYSQSTIIYQYSWICIKHCFASFNHIHITKLHWVLWQNTSLPTTDVWPAIMYGSPKHVFPRTVFDCI